MKSLLTTILCALAATFANPGSIDAQPKETPRAGWTFVPSLTFSSGYDDNVLLAAEEHFPPDDYVNALQPAGALDYFGRRLQLQTAYRGSFVRYNDLSELNSADQDARFHVRYRTTPRVTVFGGQTYTTASTTDAIELIGAPFRRFGNRTATTQGGMEARLTARTTAKGEYDFRIVTFNEDVADFITFPGGHEHYVTTSLDHAFSARLTLGTAYDLRRVIVTNGDEPILIQHGGGTAELRLNPTITLSGNLGLTHIGGGVPIDTRTGIAYGAGITSRHQRVDISARYQRSVLPAFGFGGTFQNEEFLGSVRGSFARNRAYWQQSVAWRGNEPLMAGPPVTRTLWWSSLVGYSFSRWMRVEGYYSRAHQDTQRAGGLVDRNRIGFQIVTSRPLRINR
jgi:hypothetical protein